MLFRSEARFLVVTEETARVNGVRAGDLDLVERIPMDQLIRIRDGKAPGLGYAMSLGNGHPRMGINHCRPPFNNMKVRQALAFALDKQEILDGVYSGLGYPTNQKLLRGTKWFVSEVPDRKQDAGKAKALLAEAGYPEGLKVTVAGRVGHEKILQVIQSQARKAGIEMTILIRDNPSHLAAMTNADFEISMSGGTTGPDPDLAYYG